MYVIVDARRLWERILVKGCKSLTQNKQTRQADTKTLCGLKRRSASPRSRQSRLRPTWCSSADSLTTIDSRAVVRECILASTNRLESPVGRFVFLCHCAYRSIPKTAAKDLWIEITFLLRKVDVRFVSLRNERACDRIDV